jgi:hypothetical protein
VKKLVDFGANTRMKAHSAESAKDGFTAAELAQAAGHGAVAKLLFGLAQSR